MELIKKEGGKVAELTESVDKEKVAKEIECLGQRWDALLKKAENRFAETFVTLFFPPDTSACVSNLCCVIPRDQNFSPPDREHKFPFPFLLLNHRGILQDHPDVVHMTRSL